VTPSRSIAPIRAVVALGAIAALTACARAPDPAPFEQALRAYNAAVAEAHRTGSIEKLQHTAADVEAQRVLVLVGGLRARGEVLVAHLDALAVAEVKLDPSNGARAAVLTRERWTYERLSTATRTPSTPRASRDYELRYHLARRGTDYWIVERVEFAEHQG
jgi:hypothetical protein